MALLRLGKETVKKISKQVNIETQDTQVKQIANIINTLQYDRDKIRQLVSFLIGKPIPNPASEFPVGSWFVVLNNSYGQVYPLNQPVLIYSGGYALYRMANDKVIVGGAGQIVSPSAYPNTSRYATQEEVNNETEKWIGATIDGAYLTTILQLTNGLELL